MHINSFTSLLGLTACYILYLLNHIHANSPGLRITNSTSPDVNQTQRENEITVRNNKNPLSVGSNDKPAAEQGVATAGAATKTKSDGGETRRSGNDSGTARKPRKPVKLTMKQGLTMNQVVATYAPSDVKNALCRNHTEEFKRGLRALEPWALQSKYFWRCLW